LIDCRTITQSFTYGLDVPTIHCVSAKAEPPGAALRSQGQSEWDK